MQRIAAALLLLGVALPAAATDYSYANRPQVLFPGPRGDRAHVSPFPMSRRAAAIWASDLCWRDCTSASAWRFSRCILDFGADPCRAAMDADDRACLRACRLRGGPYVNITDY